VNAARINVPHLLSIVAVALFVLVGTAHADIFVSNYFYNTVGKYYDDGTVIKLDFLPGATAAEGVQCVKLSSNRIYVASFDPAEAGLIKVYNLTTGVHLTAEDFTITDPLGNKSVIVALALDASGDVLYAAAPNVAPVRRIYAVNLPVGVPGAPCPPTSDPCFANTDYSVDVVVGPDSNVYATDRFLPNLGVKQFPPVPTSGVWNPGNGVVVIDGTKTYAGHSLANAGAMVFYDGNLWLNNAAASGNDGIFEFTGPKNPNGTFKVLNFTADPNAAPLGMDVSPKNPPGPPFDPCTGCIVVAEFDGKPGNSHGDVDQIDPKSCTGNLTTPGTCQFYSTQHGIPPFITYPNTNGPKYVRFTENCNDRGYVEICKMSCLTNPVSGYFTFEATNSGFDSGPLSIPVNACSGPIQIPNGTVTIHEAQQLGILVSNITAYDYDYQGNQISALLSFNLPFQTGNVNVVSGDVSTETVVGFTNCKSGPGELKICKVAGPGIMVGQNFDFTLNDDPTRYHVPAGPAPGGYCVVAKSFPVGTPVLVTEILQPRTLVTGITVAPPDRGGTQTNNSVIAIIDSGTTEVTFTNSAFCPICPGQRP
jgi:hypothetical protein